MKLTSALALALRSGSVYQGSSVAIAVGQPDKAELDGLLKQQGGTRVAIEQAIKAVRGGETVSNAEAEGTRFELILPRP